MIRNECGAASRISACNFTLPTASTLAVGGGAGADRVIAPQTSNLMRQADTCATLVGVFLAVTTRREGYVA